MEIETGYFLITDITGYTAFLVSSELQHAKEILDTLFEINLKDIEPPLKVLTTRGDAIFSYTPGHSFGQPQNLLDSVDRLYCDFRRQLEMMIHNTTCTCKACANMSSLDLKIFLHHGGYLVQEIGGRTELQGSDVILVHRLMKNTVKEKTGLTGYALVTEAAIEAMNAQETARNMLPHAEHYEHLGEVKTYIYDLQKVWADERERRRSAVSTEEAWAYGSVEVPVPQWVAWDYLTDLEQKKKYWDMLSVVRTDVEGGRTKVGSSFHCCHQLGDLIYSVIDWNPPHYLTYDATAFGINYIVTYRVTSVGSGSKIEFIFGTPYAGRYEELTSAFREMAQAAADRFAKIIEQEIESGRIRAR